MLLVSIFHPWYIDSRKHYMITIMKTFKNTENCWEQHWVMCSHQAEFPNGIYCICSDCFFYQRSNALLINLWSLLSSFSVPSLSSFSEAPLLWFCSVAIPCIVYIFTKYRICLKYVHYCFYTFCKFLIMLSYYIVIYIVMYCSIVLELGPLYCIYI